MANEEFYLSDAAISSFMGLDKPREYTKSIDSLIPPITKIVKELLPRRDYLSTEEYVALCLSDYMKEAHEIMRFSKEYTSIQVALSKAVSNHITALKR